MEILQHILNFINFKQEPIQAEHEIRIIIVYIVLQQETNHASLRQCLNEITCYTTLISGLYAGTCEYPGFEAISFRITAFTVTFPATRFVSNQGAA